MRAAILTLVAAVAGCGGPAEPPGVAPGDYRRIAVLGPSTAANLWAAGQGHRVIAVSDYCTVEGAAELPRIGGQLDPALERLTELEPDLVLVQGEVASVSRWCAAADVPMRVFRTDSLTEWIREMEFLGLTLKEEEAFLAVARETVARIQAVDDRHRDATPIPTLLVVSRRPGEVGGLLIAGGSSFLSELLTAAGGANLFAGDSRDYFDLNEEALIQLAPACIVEFHPDGVAEGNEPLAVWRDDFPALPAVRSGRVTAVTWRDALMPGPRMDGTALALEAALSPPE